MASSDEETALGDGTSASAAGPDARTDVALGRGDALGRYVILERIGAGGMGVVYAAYDPELDRKVAVKVLLGRASGDASLGRARLVREAQAMAKLDHPNVIAVHDVGTHDGRIFVAMDFVEGTTLTRWLQASQRSVAEILDVFVRAGRGLAAAHAKGLVHRDFKPDNVMVGEDGRVRVMDFGLARRESDAEEPGPVVEIDDTATSGGSLDTPLTKTGAVLGTPAYMAPEQFHGLASDPATDQFSFAVALWEALYGQRPFAGPNVAALAVAVTQGEITAPPRVRGVPARLRRGLERALATDPTARWRSMDELLAQLHPADRRRRFALLASAATVVFVVGWLARAPATGSCEEAVGELAGIWDPQTRPELRASVTTAALPHTDEIWARVGPPLDAYAERWAQSRDDTCLAAQQHTQSPDVIARRTSCLERRKAALRATVRLLRDADTQVIVKAPGIVADLPRVEHCDDLEALASDIELPDDPALRATIEDLRTRLATIAVTREAGRSADVLEAARELARQADATRFLPVRAETHLELGRLLAHLSDFAAAEKEFQTAYFAAVEAGDDHTAILGATALADVVGGLFRLGRTDEGDVWLRQVEALVRRTGMDTLDAAQLFIQRGRHRTGIVPLYDAAIEDLERGVAIRERRLGPHHISTIRARTDLARAYLIRWNSAPDSEPAAFLEEMNQRALDELEDVLGPDHPETIGQRDRLGIVVTLSGDLHRGAEIHRAGVESAQRVLGPDHARTASMRINLANVLVALGEREEPIELYKAAADTRRRVLGKDHWLLAWTLQRVAMYEAELGRFDAAIGPFEEALGILHKHEATRAQVVAEVGCRLARCLAQTGQTARATGIFDEAVARLEGLDEKWRDRSVVALACSYTAEALSDLDRARELARGADRLRKADGLDDPELIEEIEQRIEALGGGDAPPAAGP